MSKATREAPAQAELRPTSAGAWGVTPTRVTPTRERQPKRSCATPYRASRRWPKPGGVTWEGRAISPGSGGASPYRTGIRSDNDNEDDWGAIWKGEGCVIG
jgi:hypothetical protein